DGVIFVSIDDNEVGQLRLLMDEVFGEENFVAELIWKSKSGGANDSRFFAIDNEYIICYSKKVSSLSFNKDKNGNVTTLYNLEDEKGRYALDRLDKQSIRYSDSGNYEIKDIEGNSYFPAHKDPKNPNATWRWGKDTVKERFDELVFKNGFVYTKNYEKDGTLPRNLLLDERFGRTRTGKTELSELFESAYFTAPKPSKLIKFLLDISTSNNDIILDFFAGSGTTGDAVMQLNAEDGGNRKFILVQIPEKIDPKKNKTAYDFVKNELKAEPTIFEITKERLIRASSKIKNENPNYKGDLGFKIFETTPIGKIMILKRSSSIVRKRCLIQAN
ncbi:MAG: site-specific DNA-methyltransferase, partial [Campylobacterales bacterium]|nr:site-specific DNA-methyltransferase [Campylobacterales bacterium]